MIQPYQSNNSAVRTILYYPQSTGRNFDEIKRIIQALQKADADGVATPADWRPGDDGRLPAAAAQPKERTETQSEDEYCLDWFMCFRKEK